MNCVKCDGSTQVIDRRGVRRRRECRACGHRFSTEECVIGAAPRGPKPKKSRVYVRKVKPPVEVEPAVEAAVAAPVPAPPAKKPARWAIEELREQRRLRELDEDEL